MSCATQILKVLIFQSLRNAIHLFTRLRTKIIDGLGDELCVTVTARKQGIQINGRLCDWVRNSSTGARIICRSAHVPDLRRAAHSVSATLLGGIERFVG